MLRRVHHSLLLLVIVFLTGVAGFMILGGSRWSVIDAVYMTTISMTTVGYEEVHDLSENDPARLFTIALLISGYSVVIYATSTITAFLVEGELDRFLRRRKMGQTIKALRDHYIVCGGGETGTVIIGELVKTGRPFVVIESDADRGARLTEHFGDGLLLVQGDATEDDTLMEAGIERAKGIMITLESDKDTLFVALTARQIKRDLRIVVRAADPRTKDKLMKAGADSVVSSNFIGGMRIASEMLRPTVVSFLDEMLRDTASNMRFEEIDVRRDSRVAGKTIREAGLFEKAGVLVIAFRKIGTDRFLYNPPSDTVLVPDSVMVVLANAETIPKVRALVE